MKPIGIGPAAAHHPAKTRASYVRSKASATTMLCDGVELRVPVVQACLGECDGPRLAAAVSRSGALGTLTVSAPEETDHRRSLARIRAVTNLPVLLAFNAEWERESILLDSLSAGFRHFQLFWWNGPRLARRIRAEAGVIFWQVGTADQVAEALDFGAEVLVAAGTESGGQVRSPHPVAELIETIRSVNGAETIPIVAGGGLADHRDVASVLRLGATAALLGTRFLLSMESAAPLADKVRLARTRSTDLTLDKRLIGKWPCAPRRRLALPSGADRNSLFAGLGIGKMNDVLPARRILRSLAPNGPNYRYNEP